MADIGAFTIAMILVSWVHEKTRRSTFILQKQLEEQVSTTKRAQLAEREAADSKRKLTSYMCGTSPRAPLIAQLP